jgi:nucleoside-diphosphate-sugar epimerase
VPILESQPTVAGEAATYSRDKAGLERLLLGQDRVPATVIRPCAIHGPGDRQAREWHFVKRALDRRPFVPIAYGGDSVFHTTSAENLGELIRVVCEQPGTRALNCGDPEPPSVLEISRVLARVLEHERAEVLLPGPPVDGVGATPWSAPKTLRVDMAAAHELGYAPVVHYEEAVARTVDYLVSAARDRGWEDAFPVGARYIRFDYEAEDAFVRSLLRA